MQSALQSIRVDAILSFVLAFIFLLGPRKARIAALLSLFERCHLCNLVALRGLSRIDQFLTGARFHPEPGKSTHRGVIGDFRVVCFAKTMHICIINDLEARLCGALLTMIL